MVLSLPLVLVVPGLDVLLVSVGSGRQQTSAEIENNDNIIATCNYNCCSREAILYSLIASEMTGAAPLIVFRIASVCDPTG